MFRQKPKVIPKPEIHRVFRPACSRSSNLANVFKFLFFIVSLGPAWSTPEFTRKQIVHFEERIRPLLAENCFKCHSEKKQKGGLRLDSRTSILTGGDSGPAAVAGDHNSSLLIEAVGYRNADLQMPPKKRLAPEKVEHLRSWIQDGLPWPDEAESDITSREVFQITEEDRAYWAFQPVCRPKLPDPRDQPDAVDCFLATHWAKHNLKPMKPAGRRSLLRRAWFGLLGLPPGYGDIEAFVADPAPEAFARRVDYLLARPEYGERWGRHWLDVVRFAQTNGYERDDEKPYAWRYRDYVIHALNADKPYDEFVREQLAGDELARGDEALAATGFYRLGVWDDEPDDKLAAEMDERDDLLRTTSEVFLGLTLGCSRCHDHMFDPFSQKDYYRFQAFFANIQPYTKPEKHDQATVLRAVADGYALAVREHTGDPPATHVLIRGNAHRRGERVAPGFPEVFGHPAPEFVGLEGSSGRRLALADWVIKNPLTSRVLVNRLWHHHFGRGLVETTNDFGRAGRGPSHPRLLDWLADEFVESAWSVKHMHRLIMTSAAYQRDSTREADNHSRDPGNRYLWRQTLRRLEGEAIRDAVYDVSGRLNREQGGRGFFPLIGGEAVSGASRPGRGWEWSSEADQSRRSVYTFVKRTMVAPFLESFDYSNTENPVGRRSSTTVAPQALSLLNSEEIKLQAQHLVSSLDPHHRQTSDAFVGSAFRRVLGRNPTNRETARALEFLNNQQTERETTMRQLFFRPEIPGALEAEFHASLPASRFFVPPNPDWTPHKGRWTGKYEGIINVDSDRGPFALHNQANLTRGVFRGRIKGASSTEQIAVLFLASSKEDLTSGYELVWDYRKGSVELKKLGKGIEILSSESWRMPADSWSDFEIEISSKKIVATTNSVELTAELPTEKTSSNGGIGIRSWGGHVTVDEWSAVSEGVEIPLWKNSGEPDMSKKQSATVRTREDFCLLLFNLNEFVYID